MIPHTSKVTKNVDTMTRRFEIWNNVRVNDLKTSKYTLTRPIIKELTSVIILQLLYEQPMSYYQITEKINKNPILKIGFDLMIIQDAVKRCVRDLRHKQLLIAIPRKFGELWFEWSYSLMKVYNEQQSEQQPEQQHEQQPESVVVRETDATVYIGYGKYILIDSNDQQFDLIQQFGMSPKILKRKRTPISEETRKSLWNWYTYGESLLKKQQTDYDEPVIV